MMSFENSIVCLVMVMVWFIVCLILLWVGVWGIDMIWCSFLWNRLIMSRL